MGLEAEWGNGLAFLLSNEETRAAHGQRTHQQFETHAPPRLRG